METHTGVCTTLSQITNTELVPPCSINTYVEGDVFDDQVDTVGDTNVCEGDNS